MGGLPIRQPFPTSNVDSIDPFLLLHHADVKVPRHLKPEHAGVGPHPHRGFSPVTFIFKGGVHHRDSRGNNSVVYEGGTQWMSAGRGVIHSERPPSDIHERGGRQEIIQLWINTPASNKMDQPTYFPVQAEAIPLMEQDEGRVKIHVVAGSLFGKTGPVPVQHPVIAATMEMKAAGKTVIELPEAHNAFIYILNGKLNIEGYGIADGLNAVKFANDGQMITLEALEDSRVLLMSGHPLNEKVVARGPFVMNSETEVLEAMRDYQLGKMGVLIED
jgi:quercetin 2,3-dioxygenase